MPASEIKLARETDLVPSSMVLLDAQQEHRFQRLMEQIAMVDVHEHPMVLPAEMELHPDYLCTNHYRWGYRAVKHGGWAAVDSANFFRGIVYTPELSLVEFEDALQEVGLTLSDMNNQTSVFKVGNADEIESAKQRGVIGFLPTPEHLASGKELSRLDILHAIGIRLAGLTYGRCWAGLLSSYPLPI